MKAITMKQTVVLVLCACCHAVSGASQYSSSPDTTPDVILAGRSPVHQEFGGYVACGGDVNGDGYDDFAITANRSNDCRGRVYLYFGGKDRVYQHADRVFDTESSGEQLGVSIILADLNHDKYADVITGAIGYNKWQGRVYVYFGGPDMDERADMIFDGEPGTIGRFGRIVNAADIDRDGYTDLLVVAMRFNEDRGRAYLYYGGHPMDTTADKMFDGENPEDLFGRETDMGADVNGDGYGDLIFGSRSWNGGRRGEAGRGRAYLYYGGPKESMDTQCDRIFTGESVGDEFGGAVCLFDIDNDRYAEVMIGARSYWRHQFNQGCMYFYWGGPEIAATPDRVIEGEIVAGRRWGVRFGGDNIDCGYLNNDSYADILVGAMGGGQRGEGRVYVYYGAPKESMDFICDHTFTGERGVYGWNNSLGDINGDNLDDLVVSAPYYVDKSTNMPVGRAYVYYTKPFPGSKQMKPQFVLEKWEDAKPSDPLHRAAAEGNLDLVKSLVSKGANIDSLCEYQGIMTALHQAVIAGHKDIVEFLLSHGAHIDSLGQNTSTPLHSAAQHGHTDIALLLIDKGADIRRKDCLSDTALHHAAQKGLSRVVARLIAKGADANAKDAYGDTPLHLAAQEGHNEVLELLIAKGADVKARNRCGNTPLDNAARNGHKDTVEMLLEKGAELSIHVAAFLGDTDKVKSFKKTGVGVNAVDGTGSTALHYAVIGGQADAVKFLISQGADVNVQDIGTPLHYATEKDRKDIVELLIAAGANVNARKRFPDGDTALHSAIKASYEDIAMLLIAHGADVNASKRGYHTGDTPLITAVESGRKEIVERLVDSGADLNARNDSGDTLLHVAAQNNERDIAELLIDKGANGNAKNKWGQTPLDIALNRNRKAFVDLLIEKGTASTIHTAALAGNLEKVRSFIEAGVDVNVKDEGGMTPLFKAISGKHPDVARFLIDAGADVNASDKQGYTPLVHALWNSDSEMVRLLIGKKADINVKDRLPGYSPLHWAIMMGNKELAELVLDAGADVNIRSRGGETSLDVAAYGFSPAIGEMLVAKGAEVSSLHAAAFVGDLPKAKTFVADGVDVNKKNGMGQTALHCAAAGGHSEVATFLIDNKADINAQTRGGQTPLHVAAEAGHQDVVELLLARGADINVKDKKGRTALDLAQKTGHNEIVELLKKHGATE